MGKTFRTRTWLVTGILLALSIAPAAVSAEETAAVVKKDVMSNVSNYLRWNTPVTIKVGQTELPTKGLMKNTEILVPFREAVEAGGGKVTWDDKDQTVHAVMGSKEVSQQLGDTKVVVNGSSYVLDHESELVDGVLMVSERVLPLAIDASLHWDSAARTLTASSEQSEGGLQVQSSAFQKYGNIPVKYAHGGVPGGQNISLPVSWSHAPEGTKSFAVVMYDLHPIADNFIHWSVLNLPADTKELAEGAAGSIKDGVELNSYFGMEPPAYSGDHLYRLVVYALDTEKLDVEGAPVFFEELEPQLAAHALGFAEYDGFFKQ
ncbi:YbhB/YbcL family Raf kinase inhibitor-like protein [Paenibacillus hexagrammi]|uniref:YbhB/YbcL family Raf kinase inhibitor-like protein n=1 Tax=Paenibacillus hexagrammi TaxID=2908839 RepID=A0ABY3SIX4_9BACL|nr:YbhB/YbcL family Raf kinase inhibitor-like protein [Paenibacillus sp. YPD9-1]UJF33470.1 YbhB/YbcL family Raf kinase inhibitor-like protein [Paenibacillus sp. YPD9-1]